MNLSDRDLTFLAFGYFIDNEPAYSFKFTPNSEISELSYSETLLLAKDIWRNTFYQQYLQQAKLDQVVPLSGGIDSRALLFELLKYKEASDIITYTFGPIGSYDYEIGRKIAKKLGTKHKQIEINHSSFTKESILNFGKDIDFSCNLFLSPPASETQEFKEANIWSGTVIDVFFGRHMYENLSHDKDSAVQNFFKNNIFAQSYKKRLPKNYVERNLIYPKNNGLLAYEHILDLSNRQTKFVAKHVLLNSYNYSTMLTDDLLSFCISTNQKFHKNQKLYIDLLMGINEGFDKFPSKSFLGAPLGAPQATKTFYKIFSKFNSYLNKNLIWNYLNWNEYVLCKDFNFLVKGYLDDSELAQEFRKYMNLHQKKKIYGNELINIISLLIIKNEK